MQNRDQHGKSSGSLQSGSSSSSSLHLEWDLCDIQSLQEEFLRQEREQAESLAQAEQVACAASSRPHQPQAARSRSRDHSPQRRPRAFRSSRDPSPPGQPQAARGSRDPIPSGQPQAARGSRDPLPRHRRASRGSQASSRERQQVARDAFGDPPVVRETLREREALPRRRRPSAIAKAAARVTPEDVKREDVVGEAPSLAAVKAEDESQACGASEACPVGIVKAEAGTSEASPVGIVPAVPDEREPLPSLEAIRARIKRRKWMASIVHRAHAT